MLPVAQQPCEGLLGFRWCQIFQLHGLLQIDGIRCATAVWDQPRHTPMFASEIQMVTGSKVRLLSSGSGSPHCLAGQPLTDLCLEAVYEIVGRGLRRRRRGCVAAPAAEEVTVVVAAAATTAAGTTAPASPAPKAPAAPVQLTVTLWGCQIMPDGALPIRYILPLWCKCKLITFSECDVRMSSC